MSNSLTTTSSTGLPLASLDWLLGHHGAKRRHRQKVVSSLPINNGDFVLDLGCGPGLWTNLLIQRVGPTGHVLGIDSNKSFIAEAKKRNYKQLAKNNVSFISASIENLPHDLPPADLILCSNVYCYVHQPSRLLKHHWSFLKTGGRIVVRQFDNGVTIYSHIPPTLLFEILWGVSQALASTETPSGSFDNYLGRNLLQLFLAARLDMPELTSEVIQFAPPLSPSAEKYLRLKGLWHAEVARAYVTQSSYRAWKSYFNPKNSSYILRNPAFYFSTIEVQGILEKVSD